MQLFATFVNNKCNSFKFLVQQKLALVNTNQVGSRVLSILPMAARNFVDHAKSGARF